MFSSGKHKMQRETRRWRRVLYEPLAAQGLPRDAAEEGMTLDVTHAASSRAQAIAGVELKQLGRNRGHVMCVRLAPVAVSGLRPHLGEQGGGCGAQVVGDEQLGVGVDSCWMELPQRLEAQGSV